MLRQWPASILARRYFRRRAAIIYYHAIWPNDDRERQGLFGGLPLGAFVADLKRLQAFFRFVPLSDIIEGRISDCKRPALAITFDDGFDISTPGATQSMSDLGIRATMFVNTATLAGKHMMWMHRFSAIRGLRGEATLLRALGIDSMDQLIPTTRAWPQHEKEQRTDAAWHAAGMGSANDFVNQHKPYLTYDQLRDWQQHGHEVGFHTHSHPFCSRLTDDDFERELIVPVETLRSALDLPNLALAYPFGDRLSREHEKRLRDRGIFTALIGTAGFSPKNTPPHALERVDGEPGVDQEILGKSIIRSALGKQD